VVQVVIVAAGLKVPCHYLKSSQQVGSAVR
jgi:hypothetical protein